MSLSRCKCEIPIDEFYLWLAYLEEDLNAFHREDYFFAQIALECARMRAKNPNKLTLKKYLVKFETKMRQLEQERKGQELTPEQIQAKINERKARMGAIVGVPPPL